MPATDLEQRRVGSRGTSSSVATGWSWGRGFSSLASDGVLVVCLVALLDIARAVMITALHRHLGAHATAAAIASVFLNGFRFDLRVATLAALPSIAASLVAFRFDAAGLRRGLRLYTASFFAIATAILVAVDIGYFEEYGNQFDHFLFGLVFDDRLAIFRTIWNGYPVLRIAGAVAVAAILGSMLVRRIVNVKTLAPARFDRIPKWASVTLLVFVLATLVCCARGSLGRRPAQMKIAAVTADEFLNKMVVNPFDMLATAASDYMSLRRGTGLDEFLHHGEIGAAAQRHFRTGTEMSSIDDYATKQAPGGLHPPRHVILMVMESYSAWPLAPEYRELHLADNVLALSTGGISVPRFISAGPGTMPSLGTLLTGLPDTGLPMSYERAARNSFPTSPAMIFHRLGYRTRFFYGGYLSWQRIGELARTQGFDEVHGGGEIGNWLSGKEWGVDDEHLFDFARKMISDDIPSFDVILSVSNHPPFDVDLAARGERMDPVPAQLASRFDGSVDLNVLGHFRYADRCLGNFVRSAASGLTSPVFAITGDHYGRKFPNAHPTLFERLAVPFVLYGPSVLSGQHVAAQTSGSHIDIIPTLVDLAAPAGFSYPALGRDLLQPGPQQAGLGCSAAVTANGIVEFASAGTSVEGGLNRAEIASLRQRYDDLLALGWWRTRNGPGLPIPPRVFDCRARGVQSVLASERPCQSTGNCGTPLLAGHRGMGVEGRVAPESTLAAFRAAIATGLDYVEVDPRPTADGVLVTMHDATVDRTTFGHGRVDQMTFAAVRALRIRADGYAGEFGCERVPTFVEVLRLCRGHVRVLIDMEKTSRVDLIVRDVHLADARGWVILDGRDLEKIHQAVSIDPSLEVMIRPATVETIASEFRAFTHHPLIVQLERPLLRVGAPIVHALGARVLTNVFDEDDLATVMGDGSAYEAAARSGADILQSNRPDLMLAIRGARTRPITMLLPRAAQHVSIFQ
jgi:phosphoglycerol transferase MdoB-like AlkP superfamily enzyme